MNDNRSVWAPPTRVRTGIESKRLYPVRCPQGHLIVMVDTPGVTVSRNSCPDRGCQMRVEVTVR